MKDRVEILAPAGSMECLKAAITAGADAVYTGGALFGARAYAHNLTEEELLEAIDYVHLHGRRLYLTVNTLIKDREMEKQMYDYLLPYYRQGLDAVIVQDIGLFRFIRKHFPDLPIHASTQMTLTGVDGAKFLEKEGAQRIVTSRELSMAEVKKIADETELADAAGTCSADDQVGCTIGSTHVADEVQDLEVWYLLAFQLLLDRGTIGFACLPDKLDVALLDDF